MANKAEIQQSRVHKFLKKHVDSPYFFSNGKTQISVDFRVCPLMQKNKRGTYKSPGCPACYSKRILNVYPGLRKKVENLPILTWKRLEEFTENCRLLKEKFGWEKIRFYALADFEHEDIAFIRAASEYFTVDIISKSLTFDRNEADLVHLFDMENVWISLSFNHINRMQVCRVRENLLACNPKNVNMNYMLKYPEENPADPKFDIFSIIHFRNKKKRKVMMDAGIEESRVCGILDIDGNPVDTNGHCTSCNKCHVSYTEQAKKQAILS